jgi:hypothetical protein
LISRHRTVPAVAAPRKNCVFLDIATVLHLAGNRRNKLLAGERSTDVAMTRAGLARRGQD